MINVRIDEKVFIHLPSQHLYTDPSDVSLCPRAMSSLRLGIIEVRLQKF